ncbi:MAG: tyrosine-protein phosphatase [Myxococcales bacterium]
MTNKIGNVFHGLGRVLAHEAREVAKAVKDVDKAHDAGKPIGPALKNAALEVKDSFTDIGGASIGFAEMMGLKYSVKPYQFQVSPGLTRGSRLEGGQMEDLKARGFKGVVNLCAENDMDSAGAQKNGLNALHLNIIDNTAPTEAQMLAFLNFAKDPANQPCYVHCEAGKGRTGVATACYRMAVEGWSAEKAIAEAKTFGLAIPEQIDFLEKFGADLASGKLTVP